MQKNLNNVNEDTTTGYYDRLSEIIFDDLLNEIILGICFKIDKSSKKGVLFLDESNNFEDDKNYAIVNEKGFDVFGFNTNQIKKQLECTCPTCNRPIAAQRFAPHLEKCMGMGRNSSRIAIKRIASVTGKCDADSDEEITYSRRVKKKKVSSKKNNNGNNNYNSNNGGSSSLAI